jgi:hypothetical protein
MAILKNPIAKIGSVELELRFLHPWGGTRSPENKGWAVYRLTANNRKVVFPSARTFERLARHYLGVDYREASGNAHRTSFNRYLNIGLKKGTTLTKRAAFVGAVCASITKIATGTD